MVELFQMWALVEVLGFMCLPLTITVFHNLPDRGWAFSKAIAIAVLAFCVWLPLMVLQALPFSQFFIAGVLLILLISSIVGFIRVRRALIALVRANLFYLVVCEAVFLGMVFLLGWIRSYGPNIQNFEYLARTSESSPVKIPYPGRWLHKRQYRRYWRVSML